ncbi:hypothetical protein [Kutzneria sp. NPDC052558]|uniref:hypothetical protein n=1 Tax=Kutzneria sp. NPDC052558 TaxID=3364121 RepID=UPI0037C90ADC
MQHTRTQDKAAPPGPVDVEPLLGHWRNYDNHAHPQQVEIRRRAGGIVVEAPEWSEVDGVAFAGPGAAEAVALLAADDRVFLAAYLNKRLLVVDCYADNHFRRDHFYPA